MLYHWRAWRKRKDWGDFREQIADWLGDFAGRQDELILIGPSGGYTLQTEWLKRFKKIHAYDLDPLAPLFFRARHGRLPVAFHNQDLFWDEGRLSTVSLKTALKKHPRAAVLISNLLGQLLLEHPTDDRTWEIFLNRLRFTLKDREWASYHDLFTHERGEVIDHLTGGEWKAGLETRQFRWPLTATSLHIIEGLRSSGTPDSVSASPDAN